MKTTVTWSEAVDQAMEPTDLDIKFGKGGLFGSGQSVIGEDGKVNDFGLVRARATYSYVEAHEGEEATVDYVDPAHADDKSRLVYRASGVLHRQYVRVPVFTEDASAAMEGFIVGNTVVPLKGVSAIRVKGDNSVVVL